MKLTVGDIQMDSESGVSFDAVSFSGVRAAVADGTAASPSLLHKVAHAPRWAYGLVAAGGAISAASLVVGIAATQFWLLILPTLIFARLSAYALMLAVAPRTKQTPRLARDEAEALLLAVTDAVGVEALMRATGWTERRVVAGLAELIERGEVEEDLDVETGQWLYRRTSVLSGLEQRKTLSAEDRLKSIEHVTHARSTR